MRSIIKLIKITIVLVLIAFAVKYVYANIIIPSPFRHQLEICLENSKRLNDPLAVEIAGELCLDVYPHSN